MSGRINGTAGEAPTSIKDARAALQEAEDNLETQRTLEESLNAKLPALEESLHFAKSRVKDRINAVVGAELDSTEADRAVVAKTELDAHFLQREPVMSEPYENLLGPFFDASIFLA